MILFPISRRGRFFVVISCLIWYYLEKCMYFCHAHFPPLYIVKFSNPRRITEGRTTHVEMSTWARCLLKGSPDQLKNLNVSLHLNTHFYPDLGSIIAIAWLCCQLNWCSRFLCQGVYRKRKKWFQKIASRCPYHSGLFVLGNLFCNVSCLKNHWKDSCSLEWGVGEGRRIKVRSDIWSLQLSPSHQPRSKRAEHFDVFVSLLSRSPNESVVENRINELVDISGIKPLTGIQTDFCCKFEEYPR